MSIRNSSSMIELDDMTISAETLNFLGLQVTVFQSERKDEDKRKSFVEKEQKEEERLSSSRSSCKSNETSW